jgi:hypothetical protein
MKWAKFSRAHQHLDPLMGRLINGIPGQSVPQPRLLAPVAEVEGRAPPERCRLEVELVDLDRPARHLLHEFLGEARLLLPHDAFCGREEIGVFVPGSTTAILIAPRGWRRAIS